VLSPDCATAVIRIVAYILLYYGTQQPGYFQGVGTNLRDAENVQARPAALLYVTIPPQLGWLYNFE
jgi:hypothetical protein